MKDVTKKYLELYLDSLWSQDMDYGESDDVREAFVAQNELRALVGMGLLSAEDLAYALRKARD